MSNTKTKALVSIVLPSLNSEKHLQDTIESFVTQDYANKRLIVVDARSNDRSHDIIQSFAATNKNIFWLRKEDKGISDAINIGLESLDNNEIFGFLGADDTLLPGTLQKVADVLADQPGTMGVFFDSYSENAEGLRKLRQCPAETLSMPALLRYRTVAGLQNIYLRSHLIRQYRFNTAAKYSMDYELYLRLARDGLGDRIHRVAQPSSVNKNDGNISTKYRVESKREALRFAYQMAPFGWQKIRIGVRLLTLT